MPVSRIISAGQTGVEYAALYEADARSLPLGGRCFSRDIFDKFDGPLSQLTFLSNTDHMRLGKRIAQTVEWNTQHSDAILILFAYGGVGCSPMTILAQEHAQQAGKPAAIVDIGTYRSLDDTAEWLTSFRAGLSLYITGPTEREQPGIYQAARYFIGDVFNSASVAISRH